MKARLRLLAAGFLAAANGVAGDGAPFLWGGRAEHPAVVNGVVADSAGSVVSLRGEWLLAAAGHHALPQCHRP